MSLWVTTNTRLATAVAVVAGVVGAGVAVGGLVLTGTTAAAAATPVPTTVDAGLQAIDCPPIGSCVAVGGAQAALQRPGGGWQVAALPVPAGTGPGIQATAVSCPATGWCMAVGNYPAGPQGSRVDTGLLTETWSGGRWAAAEVPTTLPTGSDFTGLGFSGVSCPAPGTCTAVGSLTALGSSAGNLHEGVVATLAGGSWQVVAVPSATTLAGVSCPPSGPCTAVGQAGNLGAVFTPSASGWTATTVPVASPQWAVPTSVSCPIASWCAVGGYVNLRPWDPFVVTGSGTSWTATMLPKPLDASGGLVTVEGISCAAPGACTAVGRAPDNRTAMYGNGGVSEAAEWVQQPGGWHAMRWPGQGATQTAVTMTGVSCRSQCLAVRYGFDVTGPAQVVDLRPAGYWLVGADGGVFAFGDAAYHGSVPGVGVHVSDVVAMAAAPDGGGYWIVGADGGVFAFGDAPYAGSVPGAGVHVSDVVAMAATPDGAGYWVVGRDGGVYAFGDAAWYGSAPGAGVHVSDVTAIAPTPDGGGYWLVGADGGVYAFGDAAYLGSVPGAGIHVTDVTAAAAAPDGGGYWLAGTDGGVYAFGDAPYQGSVPAAGVAVRDVTAFAPTVDGGGYWLAGTDGGVYAFGDASYRGSVPGVGVHVDDVVFMAPT